MLGALDLPALLPAIVLRILFLARITLPNSPEWCGGFLDTCFGQFCNLVNISFLHMANLQYQDKFFRGIFAEIKFNNRVGIEIIQDRISFQFDPPVFEVIIVRFSQFGENKSFTSLVPSLVPDLPYDLERDGCFARHGRKGKKDTFPATIDLFDCAVTAIS